MNVNQAVFDTARPQVDLRVAQTMGTNLQVDYTFENNAARNDSVNLVANGPMIAVAAIRFGHAIPSASTGSPGC